jgi:hypothetical protein
MCICMPSFYTKWDASQMQMPAADKILSIIKGKTVALLAEILKPQFLFIDILTSRHNVHIKNISILSYIRHKACFLITVK